MAASSIFKSLLIANVYHLIRLLNNDKIYPERFEFRKLVLPLLYENINGHRM